jgi:SAM-dependent methyltransferase
MEEPQPAGDDPPAHERLAATLERLARERLEADRKYNDALTALDQAVMRQADLPSPSAAVDDHQLASLNDSWSVADRPSTGGWKGRIASIVWRVMRPSLEKQTAFNSRLVDHLNRNAAAARASQQSLEATIGALRTRLSDLMAFESRLIGYFQQITAYVDTKDREVGSRSLIVNAAVNGVADDVAKRWESLTAREQRFDAKVTALAAAHEEIRTLAGVAQHAALATKRELERLSTGALAPAVSGPSSPVQIDRTTFSGNVDAYKYVGFEDQFRGSQDEIRRRLESYLPYFDGTSDVLDVGCGRGEFLDLLKARGISARGLDSNHEMVEVCRGRGLDVSENDVVSYLAAAPDGSLGGLFAAQVVEHLKPDYLLRFLELAHHTLRPGAPLVLETLNPACWVAFFESFIRDITHVWPLHPETLQYLVLASGFSSARIEYRSPVPPADRLQKVAAAAGVPAELVETINANVDTLNARMFTWLDYAIVAQR